MGNFELESDEVVLFEGNVVYKNDIGRHSVKFTLTSKKMIFEKEKGILKKQIEIVDIIPLQEVKIYNGEVQSKQKSSELNIQTINKNITLYFSGIFEARKVNNKIIDTISGTSIAERGSDKIKGAINLVDETLGLDTRGMVKGLMENGVKGTIINGLKKKK